MYLLIIIEAIIMVFSLNLSHLFNNPVYWIFHIDEYKSVKERKIDIHNDINTIDDVKKYVFGFKYKEYKYDFTQSVSTTINRDFHGDCEDAATLGKFLFSIIGVVIFGAHTEGDSRPAHLGKCIGLGIVQNARIMPRPSH